MAGKETPICIDPAP